jgi:outer membrane immunogenic protein
LAGGQVGYRWQTANWVFGIDAQGDWADLKGSSASLTAVIPYTNRTKIEAIGLFTGQVGYAWNNVLWYVKGGAAVTDNKYDSFFTATGVVAVSTRNHSALRCSEEGPFLATMSEFRSCVCHLPFLATFTPKADMGIGEPEN